MLDGSASWLMLAPTGSSTGRAVLLVVISGTEGSAIMMSNMEQVACYYGLDDALIAVLGGTTADAQWANDVNDQDVPGMTTAEFEFAQPCAWPDPAPRRRPING